MLTVFDVCPGDLARVSKVDPNELALRGGGGGRGKVMPLPTVTCDHTSTHKTRGVVVPDGLGVAKRFQYRVGFDDLVLQVAAPCLVARARSDVGQVLDDLLGVLRLASTRLTTGGGDVRYILHLTL